MEINKLLKKGGRPVVWPRALALPLKIKDRYAYSLRKTPHPCGTIPVNPPPTDSKMSPERKENMLMINKEGTVCLGKGGSVKRRGGG